jgi:hypothetical protein
MRTGLVIAGETASRSDGTSSWARFMTSGSIQGGSTPPESQEGPWQETFACKRLRLSFIK